MANERINIAPDPALMAKYPLNIGSLGQATKLQGTWYVSHAGRSKGTATEGQEPNGNHAFIVLRQEGQPDSPHRIQCLMELEDLDTAMKSIATRLVNPTLALATRYDEASKSFVSLAPSMKTVTTAAGTSYPCVYWTCYMLDADEVRKDDRPLQAAGKLLRSAGAVEPAPTLTAP
jgi:hypothetical protein